jgi:hypothetical protein
LMLVALLALASIIATTLMLPRSVLRNERFIVSNCTASAEELAKRGGARLRRWQNEAMASAVVGPSCGNCYGTGQVPTDEGPVPCPECGGEGSLPGSSVIVEWRAGEIERLHAAGDDPVAQDVRWLVFELGRARSALTKMLSLTEEIPDDATTKQMRFVASQALGLYPIEAKQGPGQKGEGDGDGEGGRSPDSRAKGPAGSR